MELILGHSVIDRHFIDYRTGDPAKALAAWREGETGGRLLLVDFEFVSWWLEGAQPVALTAIYRIDNEVLLSAVTDADLRSTESSAKAQLTAWGEEHDLYVATAGGVLPLLPTCIPKPWGQEIWFTGVEERGVCAFGGAGRQVPIPWLQAVMPEGCGAPGEPLVLLKILDPSAQEVVGDLYFEMHEEKREVYVVTHVDREAWPDGVGAIRYGFAVEKIAAAGSEAAFRREYLDAVQRYEAVRRQIDAGADSLELHQSEARLRADMDAFTHLRPLRTGDVVVVPLRMPHSLQHGVRTIEFQTPVYERKILSFAQRVLTQDHWDTSEALDNMCLQPPEQGIFEVLASPAGVEIERIVDFADFEVRRVRVETGAQCDLPAQESYSLVMVVEGRLAVDGMTFDPEEAFLLPAGRRLSPQVGPLILLQALPR
ncbi:hypothetical protein BST95_12955 [Halioglobus japonicus]|uniref:Uncharacterized protein n=1 Tax=Halioglobus japonicus TaxID=930805 RepID=A0AAP8MHH7_9GAMM|nr:hypothetical protein [Halioglobus japonicus]AQA19014.1 hypothetical protein BST95_12955 [Halioglobus japonicus]PLW87968.1 hypothetical protein C0029_05240 [Halioglobus japonicus]